MAVTLEQAQALHSAMKHREYFYKKDADPLMVKYNLGEVTLEEWKAARQAVKDAHPYPEGVDKAEALARIEAAIAAGE